jgi:hypothetical protein
MVFLLPSVDRTLPVTEGASRNRRHRAILRFLGTCANVDASSIANSNQDLGADSATRVAIADSRESPSILRKGAGE